MNMGRKDPAWKYGIEINRPDAPKSYIYVMCKFCDKECKGGITRLKHHLAGTRENVEACSKVTTEVRTEMLKLINSGKKSKEIRQRNDSEKIENGSYYASVASIGGANANDGLSRGSRGPMDRFVVDIDPDNTDTAPNTAFGKEARKLVCMDIGRFFFENGIPFNVANSPSFINMCRSIGNYGRNLKVPTSYELSSWILKEEEETTKRVVEDIKKTWEHTGVTIMSDGWKDIRGRQLINFLVNNPFGTVFLKSVDASELVKDSDMICKLLDEVVEEVGPHLVIQVVTDNASNYKAAGTKLMEKKARFVVDTVCSSLYRFNA